MEVVRSGRKYLIVFVLIIAVMVGLRVIFRGEVALPENKTENTDILMKQEANLIASIPITPVEKPAEESKTEDRPTGNFVSLNEFKLQEEARRVENIVALPSSEESLVVTDEPTMPIEKDCPFVTTQNPNHQGVIINEVAWMGSAKSSADEWVELKNISGSVVDITGWQLVDMDEKLKADLTGQVGIANFYLLERTDDNSLPSIVADQIYVGSLENVGEGLRLFDSNCNLIDEVMASPDWLAGDNSFKKTMERQSDFSWRHYDGDGVDGIFGTPKSENSVGIVPTNNASGGSASTTSTPAPESAPVAVSATPTMSHPIISEILFNAIGSDGGKEFIELHNPSDQVINISSWSIQHLASSGSLTKKNFEAGDQIAAKSFFLIWLGDDSRADMKWSSGSLNNTGATIYLVNNTDLISTSSPVSVDNVAYEAAQLSGFAEGNSLERKAISNGVCVTAQSDGENLGNGCDTDSSTDWEIRVTPNPQNAQNSPEL